jgi:hypothetical protein
MPPEYSTALALGYYLTEAILYNSAEMTRREALYTDVT